MRKLKFIEWVAIVAAVVVAGIFIFPNWLSSVFSPTSNAPEPTAPVAVTSTTTSPTQNMQNISTVPGLQVYDVTEGTGPAVASGATVSVNYTGTLTNGTEFDSNVDPQFGHVEPFQFTVGAGQVIRGWDQGLVGMKVGGVRELVISPDLGYGAQQVGSIPPNSTLVFQVQLVSAK